MRHRSPRNSGHNDVPPEPQQNVSMAVVRGAITCHGHSNVVFIL